MDDDSGGRAQSDTVCCQQGSELSGLIRRTPATVVAVRRLAVAAFFPTDLAAATQTLPYDVGRAVATPQAAVEAGVTNPLLGETLVFTGATLIARLPDAPESGAVRLCRILQAGLSPQVGRGAPNWDSDESDAYTISARRLVASLAQLGESWQQRLMDHPTDRNGRA